MSDLLLGPYIGEFGCELTHWNPWARWKAEKWKSQYPNSEIVVSARSDREWWYEDFADRFVSCPNVPIRWARGQAVGTKISWSPQTFFQDRKIEGAVISPYHGRMAGLCKRWRQRKWKNLKLASNRSDLILLHYRYLPKCKGRNCEGNEEWWREFSKHLLAASIDLSTVASVGHLDGSRWVPGTLDLRGLPLREFAEVLAKAKVIVGPSSGPMHLAQLSRVPVVVWGNKRVRQLYVPGERPLEGKANPFQSPTSFALTSDTWDVSRTIWQFPEPEWVANEISRHAEKHTPQ